MIPVSTADQMRECDRITIENIGIPGIVLMENASMAVADEAVKLLGGSPENERVLIYCGKGNNGGDGFAVARHLRNAGCNEKVLLYGIGSELKGDAKINHDIYLNCGGDVEEIKSSSSQNPNQFNPALVIDGLLGTGFKGSVRSDLSRLIEDINKLNRPVLAIDIPSGVECDSGAVNGSAIKADTTVTFGLLKHGLVLPPGREHSGRTIIADIGIPAAVVADRGINNFLIESRDVSALLPQRSSSAHKGDAGQVFIIAGSPGLTGAASLCCNAAMRTGAGLTALAIPEVLNEILEAKLTETMTLPIKEHDNGYLTVEALHSCKERLRWADALAIGPGIGTKKKTLEFMKELINGYDKSLVIDADGLNLLSMDQSLIKQLPEDTVLTPHPGEFSRLIGIDTNELLRNRMELVSKYAVEWETTVVLKASPTITADSEGRVFINTTGNAGMASGGTGDVLTGIIATFLAQGLSSRDAAISAVYLHGAAGDLVEAQYGQPGLIASDLIGAIPHAMTNLAQSA